MKLAYPIILYPCLDTPGAYTVEVPDLPGCVTQGNDLPDALIMAEDAAALWVLDELEDGKPAPVASSPADLTPEEGGFVTLIALDMDAYAEKYGSKAVRKNVTIPAWLNTWAEKNNVNFSKELTNTLTAKFAQA